MIKYPRIFTRTCNLLDKKHQGISYASFWWIEAIT